MLKFKKSVFIVLSTMIIIALLLPISSYATEGSINVIGPGSSTPAVSNTPTPNTQASPVSSPNVITTPSNNPNLPKTGVENYTGLIVTVVLLGGTAIFAYKKIKEYNKL